MRIDRTEDSRERWGGSKLFFTDGSYIMTDYEPMCCELNYADFSVLETMPDVLGLDFEAVEVSAPADGCAGGFIMRLGTFPVFIPCYSSQNGYYSTDLQVSLYDADDNLLQAIDIECEEDFY